MVSTGFSSTDLSPSFQTLKSWTASPASFPRSTRYPRPEAKLDALCKYVAFFPGTRRSIAPILTALDRTAGNAIMNQPDPVSLPPHAYKELDPTPVHMRAKGLSGFCFPPGLSYAESLACVHMCHEFGSLYSPDYRRKYDALHSYSSDDETTASDLAVDAG